MRYRTDLAKEAWDLKRKAVFKTKRLSITESKEIG